MIEQSEDPPQTPAAQEDPEGLGRAYNPLTDPVKSDADLAKAVAEFGLQGFRWAAGLGWRKYDPQTGTWPLAPEEIVAEQVRRYLLGMSAACLQLALDEVRDGRDGKFHDELAGTWRGKASASRITAVTRLARGICLIAPERFDAHPDLLNCPNGVANLITKELSEHDPDLLFTKVAGADWVPGARHPDIDLALEAIPADIRAYAQLRYGQALTGHHPPDDGIVVHHGSGENGKTSIVSAVLRAAGDYGGVLPSHLLFADPRAHTTDLMTLHGLRLGVIEELPEEGQLSVTRVKIATAPKITARYVHQNNVTFANQCALFISTNYRPQVRETDHGTWRRLEGSIPFPYTFRKAHEHIRDENDRRGDGTLRQRIETDPDRSRARAMLAWLAEGARRWYAGEEGRAPWTMGQPPQRVRESLAEWRESCDLLYGFMTDCLEFTGDHTGWDTGAHVAATDLLAEFNAWAKGRGHREWGAEKFTARFEVHSEVREHRVAKRRVRKGSIQGEPSRPAKGYLEDLGDQYRAWFGVRFKQAGSQADQKPQVTAVRAGCADPKQTPLREGQPTEVMQSPAHPAQGRLPAYSAAEMQAFYDMADHDAARRI
jgi:P4 family phage/plasmid primase-like protien